MSGQSFIEPTPIDVGAVSAPPFAVAPDPSRMFERRAERFRAVAPGHTLNDYLVFLGGIAAAQHAVQDGLPEPKLPPEEALERAFSFGMPPLDRARFEPDEAALEAFQRLLDRAAEIAMPEPAAVARKKLAADRGAQLAAIAEALQDAAPIETLADHVFAAAALQVHFARLASRLDARRLQSVGVGACPCCGGPPTASLVVDWPQAHGVRYVACALCGTLWNHVRVKCVVCDSTEGVSYRALAEGGEDAQGPRYDEAPIKAETCKACRCYVKIMQQNLQPSLDPIADDVASLGLDMKLREEGWGRAAFNPYLLGY